MFCLFIAAISWGIFQNNAAAKSEELLENEYQRSFYDLVECIENISALSSKAQAVNSLAQYNRIFTDISWYANLAQSSLATLPLSHTTLTRTQRFLNQMSDFAKTMIVKLSQGNKLSSKDQKILMDLDKQVQLLHEDLLKLANDISKNKVQFYKNTASADDKLDKKLSKDDFSISNGFDDINQSLTEYPSLVYDGPYSDHMKKRKPQGITGNSIDKAQAVQIAKKISPKSNGSKNYNFEYVGKMSENAIIPSYNINLTNTEKNSKEIITMQISQKGGHLIMFANSRSLDNNKNTLTQKQAEKKAMAFLEKMGYQNMLPTYTTKENTSVTIQYVYTENNIKIYPDQVKVKVALDTGQIIGFEASQYFTSHIARNLPKPSITETAAINALNSNLAVESQGLAVIPTSYAKEILCYEFKCNYNDTNFLVYINAENGNEEDILKIIDTPGGTLVI
jgi:germination protein YpeB